MIYLDNAATTMQKPKAVIDAVASAMDSMGNSSRGTHDGSLAAARTIFDARVKLAEFFGCTEPANVAFTSNSTEALNTAIFGLVGRGDHVISTDTEHNSALRPLYKLQEERDVSLDFLPADRQGRLDLCCLDTLVRPNTKAIVCNHGSNLTGNINDIGRIGRFARDNGLLFIVDASQTAGVQKIDTEALCVDVLCFTGHKGLLGPQGTGGICVGDRADIKPFKVGGTGVKSYSMAQPDEYPVRLEAGTLNGHGIAGLLAAVEFIEQAGMENIRAKEQSLMKRFHEAVSNISGVTVYGDFSQEERCAIVALNINDYDSGVVADALFERYGIATRPGAHCAPRLHRALGTEDRGAVRFSFGFFNSLDEVDAAAAAVKELAK